MYEQNKSHFQSIVIALLILGCSVVWGGALTKRTGERAPLTASVAEATVPTVSHTTPSNADAVFTDDIGASATDEPSPALATPPANVRAAVVLAQGLSAAQPLAHYHADFRWPIASITKLMTALVALDTLDPQTPVTISLEAVNTEGDGAGISPGEIYTVADLVRAMMTVSSNDAAAALAEAGGGKVFLDAMAEQAATLGMTNTTFADATGLSYLNQSTAEDLVKLIEYVYQAHSEILEPSTQPTVSITEMVTQTTRVLKNINKYAGTPGFVGGKTGFTDESKGNLLTLVRQNSKVYALIVLGAEDRFNETTKLWNWLKKNAGVIVLP